jgi:hypothetical protein
MKLNTGALAITWAVISALVYLMGAILHVVSPWGAPALVSYIFHVDVIGLAQQFTWDSFFVGLAIFAVAGALVGAVTAWMYNALVSREHIIPAFASAPSAKSA